LLGAQLLHELLGGWRDEKEKGLGARYRCIGFHFDLQGGVKPGVLRGRWIPALGTSACFGYVRAEASVERERIEGSQLLNAANP
jgi:hypothetical protein